MPGHKLSDEYIRRLDRMLIEHERSRRGDRPQRRRTPQVLPPQIVRIELTANLSLGGSTTAKRLVWNGSTFVTQGDEFTVNDLFSKFQQTCKPTNQDGARGYAQRYPGDGNRWEIIELEQQARWMEFTTTAAFTTSSASVECDGVVYHDGYEPDTAITTVYNGSVSTGLRIFEGDDDAKGKAVYSPENDKYVIDQMVCPP